MEFVHFIYYILLFIPFSSCMFITSGGIDIKLSCEEVFNETQDCICTNKPENIIIECSKIFTEIYISNEFEIILKCNEEVKIDNIYKLMPTLVIGLIHWRVNFQSCPFPNSLNYANIINTTLGVVPSNVDSLILHLPDDVEIKGQQHFLGLEQLKELCIYNINFELPVDFFNVFNDLMALELNGIDLVLSKNIFATLTNLRSLVLKNNLLEELQSEIFRNLRKLELLDLSQNQLHDLHRDNFIGATSLTDLNLESNGIRNIQPDVFALLTSLEVVSLDENSFSALPQDLFAYNKNLKTFNIVLNEIPLEMLPSGLLANLPFLITVKLLCDLTELPVDLFTNSSSIAEIDLANNKLSTLPSTLLSDQVNLLKLDISSNAFEELPEGLLQQCSKLQKFNFIQNDVPMKSVPSGFLSNLPNLQMVTFDCNLEEITHDLFVNSSKILFIDLANNKLTAVPYTLFNDQPHLLELDLSQNRLQTLPPNLLIGNKQLQSLKLSHNQLTNITPEHFKGHYTMTTLYMDNNVLTNVTAAHFRETSLERIYLQNNHIKIPLLNNFVAELIFKSIRELNLSHNNITGIDFDFNTLYKFSLDRFNNYTIDWNNMNYRLELNLNQNPIHCDCNLLKFVHSLQEPSIPENLHMIIDKLNCDAPQALRGVIVRNLSMHELLCPVSQKQGCPVDCVCWQRPSDSVLLVNCTHAKLTNWPDLPSLKRFQLNATWLFVANNTLKELPQNKILIDANVTQLQAAHNKISTLAVKHLPLSLTLLDLSHNRLRSLDPSALPFLNNSRMQLILAGNPWSCDCQVQPFLEFVKRHMEHIVDFKQLKCVKPLPGIRLIDISISDICPTHIPTIIASLSVVAFLFTLALVLCYKYKRELKIWLYAHKWCLRCITEYELDNDRTYDAFVSYSHRDEDFVARSLVPELETGTPKYKLCIHIRDWLIGECIPDQIVRSISDSRRTIVVLSENFVTSVWGGMEFRYAHQTALNERRARVIVVVYGDIRQIEVHDPDLKAYLKMHTYLVWGDPLFWDKMRYVMPHMGLEACQTQCQSNDLAMNTL